MYTARITLGNGAYGWFILLQLFHNHITSRRYSFSALDRHEQVICVLPCHRHYHSWSLPSQFTSKSNNALGSRSKLFYGNPYDTCLVHISIGNVATSQYLFRCSTINFHIRLYYRPALGFSAIDIFLTRFYLLWYTSRYSATRNTGWIMGDGWMEYIYWLLINFPDNLVTNCTCIEKVNLPPS
jgi:hypothetical protein